MNLTTPFGELTLQRLPLRSHDPFQAWDAADEYLLSQLSENVTDVATKRILIINDSFGALATALAASADNTENTQAICSWSDSVVAQQSCAHNAAINHKQAPHYLPMNQAPTGRFDIVLFRVPKSLTLLQYQIERVQSLTDENSVILGAGMEKHLPRSALEIISNVLGECQPSLGRKKARVIFCKNTQQQTALGEPLKPIQVPEHGLSLQQLPGVFSRDKLDLGSRLLIEQFAHLPAAKHVADLGCGNGALAIAAQRQLPSANFYLCDCSFMAVASAQLNCEFEAEFAADNGFENYQGPGFDLVLLNPPFHQDQTLNRSLGRQLVEHALEKLQSGGELWLVANKHLKYGNHLRQRFGNCRTQASNKKFDVLIAKKR